MRCIFAMPGGCPDEGDPYCPTHAKLEHGAARQELLEDGIDPDCPLCQQGSPTRIQATNWNDRVGSPVHDLGDGSFRWCSGDGLPRGRR